MWKNKEKVRNNMTESEGHFKYLFYIFSYEILKG